MDQSSFDRIARLLGSSGATTRRQGIAAALGTAIGAAFGLTTAATSERATASKRKRATRDPETTGPCGDTRTANACKRNKDCCTNLCNIRRSRHNKDQAGRCRCVERARPCTEDRNCCSGLRCYGGLCLALPPKPSGCVSAAECPTPPSCLQSACVNGLCGYVSIADDTTCPGGQCKAGACVPCTTDAACAGNTRKKTCDTATNSCVECTADANCAGESLKTICNTDTNACVQCTVVGDCDTGDCFTNACTANACITTNTANDTTCPTGQCKDGGCVQCTTNAGCSAEATDKVCKTADNTCVQCVADTDCDVSTPTCKSSNNTCVGCGTVTYPTSVKGLPLWFPAGLAINTAMTGKEIWISNFSLTESTTKSKIGYMSIDGTGLTMGSPNPYTGSGGARQNQGLALSSDGVPFTVSADGTDGYLWQWDPATLAVVNSTWVVKSSSGGFDKCYGLCIAGSSTDGTVWVVTRASSGNVGVLKYAIGVDTAPVQVFSSLGSTGSDIKFGPGGYLYAAIQGSKKIVVLDPAVASSGSLPSTSTVATLDLSSDSFEPFALAFSGSTMFVNDQTNNLLRRYSIKISGGTPQFKKICEYSLSVATTFWIGYDPGADTVWATSWGSTRPDDAVTAILLP